jgi:hypothetical protein
MIGPRRAMPDDADITQAIHWCVRADNEGAMNPKICDWKPIETRNHLHSIAQD